MVMYAVLRDTAFHRICPLATAAHSSNRNWRANDPLVSSRSNPRGRLPCAIVGWQLGPGGLGGHLVAAPSGGVLRYVANVRSGFTALDRRRLADALRRREDQSQ